MYYYVQFLKCGQLFEIQVDAVNFDACRELYFKDTHFAFIQQLLHEELYDDVPMFVAA